MRPRHTRLYVRNPARFLCVGILSAAVSDLQDWCAKWERWRDRLSPSDFAVRLTIAATSDAWFTSDDPAGLQCHRMTFADVADVLGLDADLARERLYATLDDQAMQVVWQAVEEAPRLKKKACA